MDPELLPNRNLVLGASQAIMFAAITKMTPTTMNINIITPICTAADLSSLLTINIPSV
jgi:hypothetical protein